MLPLKDCQHWNTDFRDESRKYNLNRVNSAGAQIRAEMIILLIVQFIHRKLLFLNKMINSVFFLKPHILLRLLKCTTLLSSVLSLCKYNIYNFGIVGWTKKRLLTHHLQQSAIVMAVFLDYS